MALAQSSLMFRGKAARHDRMVIRGLLDGPQSAYDLYKQNEDVLEYSTSNRRLRNLEQQGLVARIKEEPGTVPGGRRKIRYNLTLKGSMAALLLEPVLTGMEFEALLKNYKTVNPTYELFHRLMNLGISSKSIWSIFGVQLRDSIQIGRINLGASDKVLKVLVAFELIKSIGEPMKELPDRRKEVVEAVYDFVESCPFEKFFGNMTVVILGAIAQRYLKTNAAYRCVFAKVNGDLVYTFNPLDDKRALGFLPFLDSDYSRIANETCQVFKDLSSFVWVMYDEFGEP